MIYFVNIFMEGINQNSMGKGIAFSFTKCISEFTQDLVAQLSRDKHCILGIKTVVCKTGKIYVVKNT